MLRNRVDNCAKSDQCSCQEWSCLCVKTHALIWLHFDMSYARRGVGQASAHAPYVGEHLSITLPLLGKAKVAELDAWRSVVRHEGVVELEVPACHCGLSAWSCV